MTSTSAAATQYGHVPAPRPLAERVAGTVRVARAVLDAHRASLRSRASLRAAQERRLAAVVAHAFRTVPFYADTMRARGLEPRDLRSVGDLTLLPLVERTDLQDDPDRFLSRAWSKSEYVALRSGGSTGEPRYVYHDGGSVLENTGQSERHATVLRRLTGRLRPRTLGVGSPHGAAAMLRTLARCHALIPDRLLPAEQSFSMAAAPEEIVRRIDAARPDILSGYGSYLEPVVQLLEERSGGFVPRVFAYGGDALSPATRARIETRLGAAVWSCYQAVEALKIGYECVQHRGLHVHADLCDVRIVDDAGRSLPAGETGDVVISNLVNHGTVLLNYRLGDRATLLPRPCPCGSSLPLLGFPEGRVEEWLETASGERVYSQRLRSLIVDEEEIRRFQIVQESASRVRLSIVPSVGAQRAALGERCRAAFAALLGPAVAVEVAFVDDLERTAAGKVNTVIRRPGRGGA